MTNELTTLPPSTMKTKDELPEGNIITVGDKRFLYVEVLFQPNFIEGASGIQLKTLLELYDLEIHQKKLGPDYHRLKTMVKRSIEQEIRNKNFGARNGNYERNAVVKNQGTKQRVQRILGDCWQWESNGQCERKQLQFLPRYG